MLENATSGKGKVGATLPQKARGRWEVYKNIDMCFQGDVEIIGEWKKHTSIAALKKIVEEKGYSAVCVGSFGHAALKSFDYQLTKELCRPSQGYTNELHIWFPSGECAKPAKVAAQRQEVPAGFRFRDGFGEATRGDQIGHITSGGVESHCFKGDKMRWPLQWAAMIGDCEAIDALVAAGHDPNVKMTDWFDSEPLGWAASFGQCKAIETLCAAGADPSRPANHAGNTPLSDAQREGHAKAIQLIEEYLSGARTVGGKPAAAGAAVGVVVGKCVQPEGAAGKAVATGKAVADKGEAAAAPPLAEMVELLRRELGLSGAIHEVIPAACEQLGVEQHGKSMHAQGHECWLMLYGVN